MSEPFFTIDGRALTPWGDYGHILQHGMTAHLPRVAGRLALERTGPYIPPITFPGAGDIIVTAEGRELLESSGLSGFTCLPVEKTLIVELAWENWDWNASEPAEFPESGEPEDYILGKTHSLTAAAVMGELWEVAVTTTARIIRPNTVVNSLDRLRLDLSSWNGNDLIRADDYGAILVSQRARGWFQNRWTRYVRFDDFPTT